MNILLLFTYFIAVLTLLLTPGPVVSLVIGTAANQGAKQAIKTALGTNLASLVLIALSTLILIGSLVINPLYFLIFTILGCLYLVYTAVQIIAHSIKTSIKKHNNLDKSKNGNFLKGFIVGISNPKDILFFISFFPQFTSITSSLTTSMTLLTVIWVIIDLSILSLYSLAINKYLNNTKAKLYLGIFSGVTLLLIALTGFYYNVLKIIN